jgi:ATP-binding cassette, subfamily B (MDR/TAP), member 1
VFSLVFGQFMDTFGTPPSGSEFKKQVATLAVYFIIIAVVAFVASYVESAFWIWTGNRQTNRIRALYLQSVLRQDIAFFDVHSTTGGLLSGLSEDSLVIQQATSEKVGRLAAAV